MNRAKPLVIFLLAAILAAFVKTMIMLAGALLSEEPSGKGLYCEMVEANLKNPRFGWVDYRGTYDTECN